MKKYTPLRLLFICACWLLTACNTATPENYFDISVLSTNMYMGFADEGMLRQLDSPPAKMEEGSGKPVPIKRKEAMDTKIQFLDANFEKLKQLKETADTKDMLEASKALNEYTLPVYKTEYLQLAKLYDDGAPKENIQSLAQSIHDKYYSRFTELSDKLTAIGKLYAERHSIKVNWGSRH